MQPRLRTSTHTSELFLPDGEAEASHTKSPPSLIGNDPTELIWSRPKTSEAASLVSTSIILLLPFTYSSPLNLTSQLPINCWSQNCVLLAKPNHCDCFYQTLVKSSNHFSILPLLEYSTRFTNSFFCTHVHGWFPFCGFPYGRGSITILPSSRFLLLRELVHTFN